MTKIKWQRQDTHHLFIDVYKMETALGDLLKKQENDEAFFTIVINLNRVPKEMFNKGLKAREIVEMVLPDMDLSDFVMVFAIPGSSPGDSDAKWCNSTVN